MGRTLTWKDAALAVMAGIFLVIGLYLGPQLTGLVIQERSYEDALDLVVSTDTTYNWTPDNPGVLERVAMDGSITSNGTVRVYLRHDRGRALIYDSSAREDTAAPTRQNTSSDSQGNAITAFVVNEQAGDGAGIENTTTSDASSNETADNATTDEPTQNDGTGNNDTQTFNIAPVWAADRATLAVEGSRTVDLGDYFADADGDSLSYSATSPINVTVEITSSLMTLTPDSSYEGTRTLFLTASDGVNTTEQALTLDITATVVSVPQNESLNQTNTTQQDTNETANQTQNAAPLWSSDSAKFIVNGTTEIDLDDHFADNDSDTLRYTIGLAENLTLSLNASILTIEPDSTLNGTRSLEVIASDSNSSTAQELTLQVYRTEKPVDNGTRQISASLSYGDHPLYDPNNDGVESRQGVIDLTVGGTDFNWEVDESKLCTQWRVTSRDTDSSTQLCTGSGACCTFLDLDRESTDWNATYLSTYNKNGETENNTLAARVVYYDVNFSLDNIRSDVIASDWQTQDVTFRTYYQSLQSACEDTCTLDGLNQSRYTLEFEIEGEATLSLDTLRYTMRQAVDNEAPILAENITNQTVLKNRNATLNLSAYFTDPDEDELSYSHYESEELDVIFDGDTATLVPKKGFTGTRFLYISASDGFEDVRSNIFKVMIEDRNRLEDRIEVGRPVTWVERVDVSNRSDKRNIRVDVPKQALNVTVLEVTNDSIKRVKGDKVTVREGFIEKSLEEFSRDQKLEQLSQSIQLLQDAKSRGATKVSVEGINLTITDIDAKIEQFEDRRQQLREPSNQVTGNAITGNVVNSNAITGFAVSEQPISADEEGNATVEIDEVNESTQEVEVEYTTPAPSLVERSTGGGDKELTISSDFGYTDVFVGTNIPETEPGKVSIYWLQNGSRQSFTDVDKIDTDLDGKIDRVEWYVPHLSSQTFEIIIEISAAQHLDTDREFIEDIYDSVREQDGNWSPEIGEDEYVRVTFERPLDSSKDITLYAREMSGSPSIEVYEAEENELLMEFESIQDEQYQKKYLTALNGTQDRFDLKVVGGSVEFDHIIDPTPGYQSNTSANLHITNSLRFNDDDSAYLNWTPASAGNRTTWTWSGWVKRGNLGTEHKILASDGWGAGSLIVEFRTNDTLRIHEYQGDWNYYTDQVFRDPSDWFHLTIEYDTTRSVASDRINIYIDGEEVAFPSGTDPPQFDTSNNWNVGGVDHHIGRSNTQYFDGYLADINFIDGQALNASSFGRFNDAGDWIPRKYRGTYGDNGFYLPFNDTVSVGKDFSGNANDFDNQSIGLDDQVRDTPFDNYATLNPIYHGLGGGTLSDGNTKYTGPAGRAGAMATLGVSQDKWVFEVDDWDSSTRFGWAKTTEDMSGWADIGNDANSVGIRLDGQSRWNGTGDTIPTFTAGTDVLRVEFDFDNENISFFKNGELIKNYTSMGLDKQVPWAPVVFDGHGTFVTAGAIKFGSQGFTGTPTAGFKALSTANLPQPNITIPSNYFDVVTYAGTGAEQSISNLSFSPDLVWVKNRDQADDHIVYDSLRGAHQNLRANDVDVEITDTAGLDSFDSNGFTIAGNALALNTDGEQFVAWAWKNDSRVGFDIVTYSGTGSTQEIEHDLGSSPDMVIAKGRDGTARSWRVGTPDGSWDDGLYLDTTNSLTTENDFNNEAPNSTHFTVTDRLSESSTEYVAYAFAEKDGFSAFGNYTGNGNADGPFIYTGFKPRYVMYKRTDSGGTDWFIRDAAREISNPRTAELYTDANNAENDQSREVDFLSNGFKIRATHSNTNADGGSYIYMAFAEHPFKPSIPQYSYYDSFDGQTTDFDAASNISNVPDAIIEKQGKGRIKFLNPINASNAPFDTAITISDNLISLNSSAFHSSLNSSANLTIQNLAVDEGQIMVDPEQDGTFHPCEDCSILSTASGADGANLTFNVTGFSSYKVLNSTNLSTVPEFPKKDDNVTFRVNVSREGVASVNFTVIDPAGTKVLDSVNGSNPDDGQLWNVTYNLSTYGTWLWNASVHYEDGYIANSTTREIVLMELGLDLDPYTTTASTTVTASGRANLSDNTNVSIVNIYRDGTLLTKGNFTDSSFSGGTLINLSVQSDGETNLTLKRNESGGYPNATGNFTSRVFDAGGVTNWTAVSWQNTTPVNTSVQILTRVSNDSLSFTGWDAQATSPAGIRYKARYIQYAAKLNTTNESLTPILHNVTLNHTGLLTNSSGHFEYEFTAPSSAGTYAITANATQDSIPGTDTEYLTVTNVPSQVLINLSTNLTGYGRNTTLVANLTDNNDSVSGVLAEIKIPRKPDVNLSMEPHGDLWKLNYSSFDYGNHSFRAYANSSGVFTSSTNLSFQIAANLTIGVRTLKDIYTFAEFVNLTDPPNLTGVPPLAPLSANGPLVRHPTQSAETPQQPQQDSQGNLLYAILLSVFLSLLLTTVVAGLTQQKATGSILFFLIAMLLLGLPIIFSFSGAEGGYEILIADTVYASDHNVNQSGYNLSFQLQQEPTGQAQGDNLNSSLGQIRITSGVSIPAVSAKFNGDTTDFGAVENPESFCDLVLEIESFGKIEWKDCVNIDGVDFNNSVFLERNKIDVQMEELHSSLDSAANVTMRDIPNIRYPRVMKDGKRCEECSVLGWTENNTLGLGTVTFNTTGFSNYTIVEGNQSKVENNHTFGSDYFLLLKTQFFNETSGNWTDDVVLENDSIPRSLDPSELIKLDLIFNGRYNVSQNTSHGEGTYRAFAAATDGEGTILKNLDGSNISAQYNFTIDLPAINNITLNNPLNNSAQGSSTITFDWTVSHNTSDLLVCDLIIDDVTNISSVQSNQDSPTQRDVGVFIRGQHNWSVECIVGGIGSTLTTSVTNNFTSPNNPPIIENNYTIPNYPMKGRNVTLYANVSDLDNRDDIDSVNFTLIRPDGTALFTQRAGDTNGDQNFNTTANLSEYGTWRWNLTAYDAGGALINTSTRDIILMEVTIQTNVSSAINGSDVLVWGRANLSNGTNATSETVELFIDEATVTTATTNSTGGYSAVLPANITPGIYTFKANTTYSGTIPGEALVGFESVDPPRQVVTTADPNQQGFGQNVTLEINITNGSSDIDTVLIEVTPPRQGPTNYTATLQGDGLWKYNYTDYHNGTYSATAHVNTSDIITESSPETFEMFVNLTIGIRTLRDTYLNTEQVNLTDPPEPEPEKDEESETSGNSITGLAILTDLSASSQIYVAFLALFLSVSITLAIAGLSQQRAAGSILLFILAAFLLLAPFILSFTGEGDDYTFQTGGVVYTSEHEATDGEHNFSFRLHQDPSGNAQSAGVNANLGFTEITNIDQLPAAEKFDGETTDFTNVPDLDSVCDAVVENSSAGKIAWTGCVNADGADLDNNVIIKENFIEVRPSGLHSSFNTTAELTMESLPWGYPAIYRDGQLCEECGIESWDSDTGVLTFNTTGFSNFTTLEGNQSKVQNQNLTNASIYLLIRTQFHNGTAWLDDKVMVNDSDPRPLPADGSYIKFDALFNGRYNVVENSSFGGGTYRVIAQITDENDEVVQNLYGENISAVFNYTVFLGTPNVTFVDPTPLNNSRTTGNSQIINVSVGIPGGRSAGSCTLEVHNGTDPATNYTMDIEGVYCDYTLPTVDGYNYTIKAYVNDTEGYSNLTGNLSFRENTVPEIPDLNAPLNNSRQLADQILLNYSSSDNDTDQLDYHVYFGTSPTPTEKVYSGTSETFVVDVEDGTTYYWNVVADDSYENSSNSVTYQFRANQPPARPLIITPNLTGISLRGGQVYNVSWVNSTADSEGDPLTIDLYYSTDSGSTYPFLVAQDAENNGTFDWTVPSIDTSNARILAVANDTYELSQDESDNNFIIDSTAPLISLDNPPNNTAFNNGTFINLTITDALSGLDAVLWDNGSANRTDFNGTYDINTTGWGVGEVNLTIYANDTAGNLASRYFRFTVTAIEPVIQYHEPAPNQNVRQTVRINVTGTPRLDDESFVNLSYSGLTENITFTQEGDNYYHDLDTTSLSDGPLTLGVFANDTEGNVVIAERLITVDNTAPAIRLDSPANDSWKNASIEFLYTPEDANALTSCSLIVNGSTQTTSSSISEGVSNNFSRIALADGVHNWTVSCTDQAGNQGTNSTGRIVKVDTTLPDITIIDPPNGTSFQINRTINFSVTESGGAGLANVTWSSAYHLETDDLIDTYAINTSTFPEGKTNITIKAIDQAGNIDRLTATYILDSTPPIAVFNSPGPNQIVRGIFRVNLSATDALSNLSGLTFAFNGSDNFTMERSTPDNPADFTYDWNTTNATDKRYILKIYGNDTAENIDLEARFAIVDNVAPSILVESPANQTYSDSSQNSFTFTPHDNRLLKSCSLLINGSAVETVSSPTINKSTSISTTLADGVYRWDIQCSDTAVDTEGINNVAQNQSNNTLIVDTDFPDMEIGVNDSSPIYKQSLNVSANATDSSLEVGRILINDTGTTREFPFNLSGAGQFSQNFTVSCTSGCVINLTAIANDTAGNVNRTSTLLTVESSQPSFDLDEGGGFFIQDSSGGNLMVIDSRGDLDIKGLFIPEAQPIADTNDFVLENATGAPTLVLENPEGNLRIRGTMTQEVTPPLNPGLDAFVVENASGSPVAYVNKTGHIFLRGRLTEDVGLS